MEQPHRDQFLRHIPISVWQYLAFDIIQTVSAQQALQDQSTPPLEWAFTVNQWIERGVPHLAIWFAVNRLFSDFACGFLSINMCPVGY